MKLTKDLIKEFGITDFLDGDNCQCKGCMFGRQILANQEKAEKYDELK